MMFSSGTATLPSSDANITSTTEREQYAGYYFGLGVGAETSGSSQTFIRERSTGNSGALNSAGGTSTVGAGSTAGVNSGTSKHLVEITLTRALDVMDLVVTVDGDALISRSDASGVFDFNTLIISNNAGTGGGQIYLDDLQVAVVPEPGSVALIGGGLLLLGAVKTFSKFRD